MPHTTQETTPRYLYKILSLEHWQKSQGQKHLVLSSNDDAFIHFSKEDQADAVIKRKFAGQAYVLIKIETAKLPGILIFELNSSKEEKFYHLYNGSIPFETVVEFTIMLTSSLPPSSESITQP